MNIRQMSKIDQINPQPHSNRKLKNSPKWVTSYPLKKCICLFQLKQLTPLLKIQNSLHLEAISLLSKILLEHRSVVIGHC